MKLNLNISGWGPLDLLWIIKETKSDITKISLLELEPVFGFIDKNIDNLKLSADYLVMASLLAYLNEIITSNEEVQEVEEIQEDYPEIDSYEL